MRRQTRTLAERITQREERRVLGEVAKYLSPQNENVKRGYLIAAIRDLAQSRLSLQGNVDHGMRSRYQAGCRCLPCRGAEASYRADLRRLARSGKPPLGALVSAKEAGLHIRMILVERYTRQQLLAQTGLHRNTLPHLNASHRCRLKTILRLRRAHRILLGRPDETSETL